MGRKYPPEKHPITFTPSELSCKYTEITPLPWWDHVEQVNEIVYDEEEIWEINGPEHWEGSNDTCHIATVGTLQDAKFILQCVKRYGQQVLKELREEAGLR